MAIVWQTKLFARQAKAIAVQAAAPVNMFFAGIRLSFRITMMAIRLAVLKYTVVRNRIDGHWY